MPFLTTFAKEHFYQQLENVVGYSFAIQSSMLSGTYPDDNDHWMPYFYFPENSPVLFKTFGKVGSIFNLDKFPIFYYLALWQIRRVILKKGVQANNIPSSLIGKMNIYPYYYMCELPYFYDLRRILWTKCQTAFTYIGPPDVRSIIYNPTLSHIIESKNEKELILAYDDRLDMLGHEFGPNSNNCLSYAKFLDSALCDSYRKLKKRFGDYLSFFVFSDHGQCDLTYTVNLPFELQRVGLSIGKDYLCFLDATLALFWVKDQVAKEKLVKRLEEINVGRVIDENLKKIYHIAFQNRKHGDIIFSLNPGGTFFPNAYSPLHAMKGLHGYLPEDAVQKAFLIGDKSLVSKFDHVKDFKDFMVNAFS